MRLDVVQLGGMARSLVYEFPDATGCAVCDIRSAFIYKTGPCMGLLTFALNSAEY